MRLRMNPPRSLALAACCLLAAACSPAADDTPARDVPRDVRDDAGSACGPSGECADAYLSCCPSGCVDLSADLFNCGECDFECALDEICQSSVCFTPECMPECDARQLCCGGDCIDPMSDNANCGDCGQTCDAPLRCLGGACMCSGGTGGDMCATGEDCCPTGCVDLMTDPENCGVCGASCGGLPCNAGQCTCGPTVCPVGQACCDTERGTCADLTSDMDHCGHCDTKCDSNRSNGCVAGECMCGAVPQCSGGTGYPFCTLGPAVPTQRCCADGCRQVNDYACARCGGACPAGTECTGSASLLGYCTYACEVPSG
jgi:hypothetical protein